MKRILLCIILICSLCLCACANQVPDTPNDDTTQEQSPNTQEKEETPKVPSHKPPAELTDITSIRVRNLITKTERTLDAETVANLSSMWKEVVWVDGGTKTAFQYCLIVNEDIVIYYDPLGCLFEDRENEVYYHLGLDYDWDEKDEQEMQAWLIGYPICPEIWGSAP